MSSILPKFEGEIILSTNTGIGTFASTVITIPLGRYFLGSIGSGGATRSLLAEIQNQLRTATSDATWTVTISDSTDAATGKVTIARSTAFTATWSSTSLRNILGFTGNLSTSSTASFTGANHAKFLWLPNCGRTGILSPEASTGYKERDHSISIAPDGTIVSLAYSTRSYDSMRFDTLRGNKTWNSLAVVTNEALEQFYTDVIGAALRVRFYPARSSNSTFRTWYVEDAGHFDPQPRDQMWVGGKSLYAIRYKVRETS